MATLEPTEADHAAASLEWAREHHKTAEEMRHLTPAEVAEVERLAQIRAIRHLLDKSAPARKKEAQRIRLDKIEPPLQMTPDDARRIIRLRIDMNLANTRHPFHHMAADGTIVDRDPTLDHLVSLLTDAPPAVPVDRKHYGSES